jgi:hypothetical protein
LTLAAGVVLVMVFVLVLVIGASHRRVAVAMRSRVHAPLRALRSQ